MSDQSASSGSSSAESKSTSLTSSPKPDSSSSPTKSPKFVALELLLKKHSSELADNPVALYHKDAFIDRIDPIVQQWMVKFIFELKHFQEKELTTNVEQAMIATIRADLDRHFPIRTNNTEIDRLVSAYRDFSENHNHENLHVLPNYYSEAIYMPGGVVPENGTMERIFSILRPKLSEALQQLWRLNTAIHLLAPTVEFGHNTGELVQRRIKSSICAMWASISAFLFEFGWFNYAKARINRLKSLFKFSQSEDARLGFVEFERSYFRQICSAMQNLVFNLIMLNHVIMQHMDLLKKPRTDHTSNFAASIIN